MSIELLLRVLLVHRQHLPDNPRLDLYLGCSLGLVQPDSLLFEHLWHRLAPEPYIQHIDQKEAELIFINLT